MTRAKRSWLDEPMRFPALLPPYVCPCCGETRQSVQYGTADTFACAECEWAPCNGEHKTRRH